MSEFNYKYNLTIGFPTMGMIDWRFASSLMSLILPQNTNVIWQVKAMIDTSRNSIVELFLKNSSKYLFMCDDDMTFEPDIIEKLMKHDVDIVGALAFKRRPDYQPCVYRQDQKTKQFYPILPNVFQEVDVVGSGGILIKMEVLQKMNFPWFETTYSGICNECLQKEKSKKNSTQKVLCRKCEQYRDISEFNDIQHFSVDFDFCIKAKKEGFKIFVDPEAEMKHISDAPLIDKSDFLKHVQNQQQNLDNKSR